MKKIAYLLLAFVVIMSSISLVACGNEEDNNTSKPSSSQTQTSSENEQKTTPSKSSQTSSSASGGGMTWSDVPVYPGADQVHEVSWSIPPAEGEWADLEWKYYQSGDSVNDIKEFYKDKMPDNGWEESFWMDAGEFAMGMYMKNGEKDGAYVWVGGDNGDTVFALMRGTH